MVARWVVCVVCILGMSLGAVSACGGASDSGLFGSTGGTDSGADGSKDAAAHDAALDASTQSDLVHCEGTPGCKVGAEVCCRKDNGGNFSYSCTAHGSCNGGPSPLEIPCDTQHDCETLKMPGTVCCVTASNQGAASVACVAPTECTVALGRTPMCDPMMAGSCPGGMMCKPSAMTIPGYNICQ